MALIFPEQRSALISFLTRIPNLRGNKRVMIFLGRLHQKKGVELLVRAWAESAVQRAVHTADTYLVHCRANRGRHPERACQAA